MAKVIKTYENGEIKNELHFNGEVFLYTMKPAPYGKQGDAKCFEAQVREKYGEEDEEMLDAVDMIDNGSEDDIEESLQILAEAERHVPAAEVVSSKRLEDSNKELARIKHNHDAYEEELNHEQEIGEEGMLDVSVLVELADSVPFLMKHAHALNRIEELWRNGSGDSLDEELVKLFNKGGLS